MTQNIYDDEGFFAGYSQLGRSVHGLDGAAEWPALRAMLPDLPGSKVLDMGCGFGWFCRWARAQGAASVLGVDVSERMLARAAADMQDAAITYARADLESFEPAPDSFDLVYSSLALHYIADVERLISAVYRSLRAGGSFVFSVEHPIYTAPADPRWAPDPAGRRSWPVNGYLREGPRSTNWLAPGVIKQHRVLATYINTLVKLSFELRRVEEWCPTDEQIAARPELAEELERPMFLLVSARR